MAITHAKVSAKSDGADASLVQPSDWNADHTGSLPYDTAFEIVLDNGGSVLATGIYADIECPFGGAFTGWTLLADQTGSLVIDLWLDSYSNYPPTIADTITASAKPTLSSTSKNTDSALSGWTTSFSEGDVIRVNVDSAATITRATLSLKVTTT